METRANFILIGAFTLLGIIGSLIFLIWLSSVQLDRQYASYGILFDDVTGLAASGDVVFNGINVGRVIELRISETNPSKVYVGIEVDASTPVRTDTVAQLSSSGVTGVSFISLSNTRSDAPPLTTEDGSPPIIRSRRSTVQQLVEDAPDLLTEVTELIKQFQALTGPDNQAFVGSILKNLDAASGDLQQALADFSQITGTVGTATEQITLFTSRLDSISAQLETTLGNADKTLASATGAFDTVSETVSNSGTAIQSAQGAFAQAESLMRDEIPDIVARISDTVDSLNLAVTSLSSRGDDTLAGFDQMADLANARLTELETTLNEADTAFVAVTEAADSFYALVDGDGTLLVSEARTVLASAGRALTNVETVIETDVPALVSDIRGATATASQAVDRVAADLTGLTARLDPLAADAQGALTTATRVLERAGSTLDGLDGTLAAADGALSAAETAFDAASGVLATDLGPTLEDIRSAAARINEATARVSDDIPAVTSDLRDLIARADAVVAEVQTTVGQAAPGIRTFTGTGLSELSRLGTEARSLVRSLEQLVRRIERDPARFFLEDRVPEYRR